MTLLLIPVLTIGIFLNVMASYGVYFIAVQLLEEPFIPLPDIVHLTTPKIDTYIPDYFLWSSCCYALLYYNGEYNHLHENMWTFSICLIVRALFVFITMMPTCMTSQIKYNSSYYETMFHSTHDLMFSGHTLCFAFIGYVTETPLIYYIGPILLVLARQHYTIDVIMAGLIYNYVYLHV